MNEYACQYVVARFLSNPIREEAKNIGIILQCPHRRYVGGRFEEDLGNFPMRDADRTVITSYAEWFTTLSDTTAAGDSMFTDRELDLEFLPKLSRYTMGSIQFTEPRGCITSDPDQTLRELYEMLVMPDDATIATGVKASEKSRTFPREFYRYLRDADPITSAKVKANLRIEIEHKKLSFDYGYKRPGNKGIVLYETVDFSKGTFSNRITQASPTIVKFDIVKKRLQAERFTRYAVVKPLSNGHTGNDSQELDILKSSADDVFSFYDPVQMSNLVSLMQADFTAGKF